MLRDTAMFGINQPRRNVFPTLLTRAEHLALTLEVSTIHPDITRADADWHPPAHALKQTCLLADVNVKTQEIKGLLSEWRKLHRNEHRE